uniref:CD74 molecule n=2 Tax=Cairina moschata TaxID=8855 RepID=A0A8C3GI59_CAIMO
MPDVVAARYLGRERDIWDCTQLQYSGRDPASSLDPRPSEQSSAWQQLMRVPAANGAFFFLPPPRRGWQWGGAPGGYFQPWPPPGSHFPIGFGFGADGAAMAEEQRDLISDRGSGVLPIGDTQRSAFGRRAALSTLSILVALLIAGQAVTIYFVYQQNGQISKLTRTSQNLQLEALQRKLPQSSKPASNMKMSMVNTPLAMRVLPLAPSLDDAPVKDMGPPSNKTEDQVRHLLLQADPKKMFPELKDSLLDNLKSLKKTMTDADWKSFESWMHKWLLFEMAKSPKPDERKAIPAEKGAVLTEPDEMIFSGVDMLKLGAEKAK